ncbi:NAD(P)/FAD-dependent oxidoreductase [Campylobacter sp. RM16187]|uniref:NAD(P)/FAD-dependent oxidoreductase n=1 Tax=Campylobacter sp. RM16187 TaxID=1660063 RepID=UPI0021B6E0A1|nr:aminoacetone oxidase family FAD-binding enzyme [Campylobacter sp. RM16187]QKG30106.1 flavoprotein, HI0933 family [Campylobacter sp. RM16187]
MTTTNKIYDVLIIGAGAAGFFLAANLHGKSVAILEKNPSAGKKIIASGGGKCNVTNRYISAQNYLGDEEFVTKTLLNLDFSEVLEFFSELKFKEIKQNQFFCASSAKDVLGVLLRASQQSGAKIFYNCDVKSVSKISNSTEVSAQGELSNSQNEIFEVLTHGGQKFSCKHLVIASGGLSYKALGASEIGYEIAHSFGIEVARTAPALVGFTVQKDEFWFKNLSGVSLNAEISLSAKNLAERKFSGDVLFTHKGISGPAILNASLFWQKGTMSLNFLPNFSFKNLNSKKQLSTILPLAKRFTLEFLKSRNLADKSFNEYSQAEKTEILKLQEYKFAPAGTFGFERAEVTKGGVLTSELNQNFESKKQRNLYFIGEVLDVTGMLGGYNIHFAFASAKTLARYLQTT